MTNEIIEKPSLLERFKRTPVIYSLVLINIAVFVMIHITNLTISDGWLVNHLAKISYRITVDRQYYRLFTAIFTHQDLLHVFFNSFAIIILGRPIEIIFGKSKFLIIFLTAGLFGSLASFIFSANAAIGASGGVFGIFGVHVYFFVKNREKYLRFFGKDILQLLVINIVIGFIIPNIDFWGHFGGLFGGFLSAMALGLTRQASFKKSIIVGCIIPSIIFIGTFTYFNTALRNDRDEANALLVQFDRAFAEADHAAMTSIRESLETERISFPPSLLVNDRLLDYLDILINTK